MARVTVTGKGVVLERFKGLSLKGNKTAKGEVGFKAPYAVYVHEDLTKKHSNGQAKFLEIAFRTNLYIADQIVVKNLQNKESIQLSVERALKYILTEAKKLVPVDTGFLRDSGYVKVT